MNASTMAALSLRHPSRLRTATGALALAALATLALSSCSKAPATAGNYACADKVAQASVSVTVPGLFKCLSVGLQNSLHANGHDGDGALVNKAFASSVQSLGGTADVATYELTLLPQVAADAGSKTIVLAVWIDAKGLVTNLGVPAPIF